MYVGPLLFGHAMTELNVVFDTGSDWLVIESKDCYNCQGDGFDANNGSVRLSKSISERNYGSASLSGYEIRDRVCLSFDTCVYDFEFFLIQSQVGIREPIDGIMGLSLNY